MNKYFIFFLSVFLCLSCDDGDIITTELDFEDSFDSCGDIVFYKTRENPAESLSIQITSPSISINDLLNVDESGYFEATRTINGSSNTFNLRSYKSLTNNLFCNDIPPADLVVIANESSDTGTVIFTTQLSEDDNDGIPAQYEDINGNGNLNDDDTDGDGLPNYLDIDDDGDNVLTTAEGVNFDDTVLLTTARDSDNDNIPDYLDNDDDNDGVLTRNEENDSRDQNPSNDITNINFGPDYLNPEINSSIQATSYRVHRISQDYKIEITVQNIKLPTLTQDNYYFGKLNSNNNVPTERYITPEFN